MSISFCGVNFLQSAKPVVLYKEKWKKEEETIVFERSIRTIYKWRKQMESAYKENPKKTVDLMFGYVDVLDTWNGDETAFWIIGKTVRDLLTEWMEKVSGCKDPNKKIVDTYTKRIDRLNSIFNSSDPLLSNIIKEDAHFFYDELWERDAFPKETLECLISL
jgi:hypothetical protein